VGKRHKKLKLNSVALVLEKPALTAGSFEHANRPLGFVKNWLKCNLFRELYAIITLLIDMTS
jgi:hypothetical protein